MAESFVLCLSELNAFQTFIKVFLEQTVFDDQTSNIIDELSAMDCAMTTMKRSKMLQKFLKITLKIGNFINGGNYQGDASGFDLIFLTKLMDLRSNRKRHNMLHFVLNEFTTAEILEFLDETKIYREASKIDPAAVKNQVNKLTTQLNDLKEQTKVEKISDFDDFFKIAIPKLEAVNAQEESLDETTKKMTAFLYPGKKSTPNKIRETLEILATFGEQVETVKINQIKEISNSLLYSDT